MLHIFDDTVHADYWLNYQIKCENCALREKILVRENVTNVTRHAWQCTTCSE